MKAHIVVSLNPIPAKNLEQRSVNALCKGKSLGLIFRTVRYICLLYLRKGQEQHSYNGITDKHCHMILRSQDLHPS